MKAYAEMTDTFCGEANYSWVRRAECDADGLSDLAIVRRIKRQLGIDGVRCTRETWGETIVLRPIGVCAVIFIDFRGDE